MVSKNSEFGIISADAALSMHARSCDVAGGSNGCSIFLGSMLVASVLVVWWSRSGWYVDGVEYQECVALGCIGCNVDLDGLNCLDVICGEKLTVLVALALFVIEPGRDADCVGD